MNRMKDWPVAVESSGPILSLVGCLIPGTGKGTGKPTSASQFRSEENAEASFGSVRWMRLCFV
jgi:hypothetical protein